MARRWTPAVLVGLAGVLVAACGSGHKPQGSTGFGGRPGGGNHGGGGGEAPTTVQLEIPTKINHALDLLFVIDDSWAMAPMQQKLVNQISSFFGILDQIPGGPPDLHVAVISSDLGAPGDVTKQIGCTNSGDAGAFQATPRGTCTVTTLASGATFLSDDGKGQRNFSGPIENVVACILPLGSKGCGFGNQLAAISRALGADGSPPPAGNASFLRPTAFLGIIMLTNNDDCSAPPDTTIYSLNGGPQSLANPDGPLTSYRCNGGPRGGHACTDLSTGLTIVPPLTPPADATGRPPVLQLAACHDNDTGSSALIPVDQLVQQIKGLKADPDNQIVVVALAGPTYPYGIQWLSGTSGELWPQVMHSCGLPGGGLNPEATSLPTDGSFGDPAVRISQFVNAFSINTFGSICDPNYYGRMATVTTMLGGVVQQSCLAIGAVQRDASGTPACTVVTHLLDPTGKMSDLLVPSCDENGNAAPCWTLSSDTCVSGSFAFGLTLPPGGQQAVSVSSTVTCSVCSPGSGLPGC
jgi:hypothetical protein